MRPEKQSLVGEIRDRMEKSDFVIYADYAGLSMEMTGELRRRLREMDGSVTVVKNTLLAKASSELGWDSAVLEGPTAIVTGSGDVTQAAKLLKTFRDEYEILAPKGGRIDGQVLEAEDISRMAALPARPVLLGKLVGTIAAPMSQLVGMLNRKTCSLLYVLKAIEEKKNSQ